MYTGEGSTRGGRKAVTAAQGSHHSLARRGDELPQSEADRLLAMLRDEFELTEVSAVVATRVLRGLSPGFTS
jgi:hypothetical protein